MVIKIDFNYQVVKYSAEHVTHNYTQCYMTKFGHVRSYMDAFEIAHGFYMTFSDGIWACVVMYHTFNTIFHRKSIITISYNLIGLKKYVIQCDTYLL